MIIMTRTYEPHPTTQWTVKEVHKRNEHRFLAVVCRDWINENLGKGNLKPGRNYSRAEMLELQQEYSEDWTFYLDRRRIKEGIGIQS